MGAVQNCYRKTNNLKQCDAGKYGVPNTLKSPKEPAGIDTVDVKGGIISLVPKTINGIEREDDYILSPYIVKGRVRWQGGGKAVEKGYIR